MRALITGGTGFVGNHLISLLKTGSPYIAVIASGGNSTRHPEANYYDLDIRNAGDVGSIVNEVRPTHVFHLAGVSAVDVSWRESRLNFEVNVCGAYNLFEAAMSLPAPPKVLNISTSQVYAVSDHALSEESPVRPANPYAVSKAMAEMIGAQYQNRGSGGIITARSFNHTGPGQPANFVIPSMAKQFAEIELGIRAAGITVGNIQIKRDFTDVRDVVRAYLLLIERGVVGEIYNVCSGVAVRLADILGMFQSVCATEVKIEIDPARLRTSDPLEVCGDPQKLRDATGWQPRIPLIQTISDTLDSWKAKLKSETTSGR